jgi:sarcosine oxidase
VLEWFATNGGAVTVRTAKAVYHADHLVISAGGWNPQILASLRLPIEARRQVVHWIEPRAQAEIFDESRMPVFMCEREPGERIIYGFPSIGNDKGVKVGIHGSDAICTPETIEREILDSDKAAILARTEYSMPLVTGPILRSETCIYTMTPDEHFVIDRHPELPQVVLAAGFSGHGFKFASVVGEILADLAMKGRSSLDISLFALNRF